jgi:uncharacterized membrane protein YccC
MLRVLIYGIVGAGIGLIFGAAISGRIGAVFGTIACCIIGVYIGAYMNRHRILDRPFFIESEIEPALWMINLYWLWFLPPRLSRRVISYIRSILENWV